MLVCGDARRGRSAFGTVFGRFFRYLGERDRLPGRDRGSFGFCRIVRFPGRYGCSEPIRIRLVDRYNGYGW